MIQRLWNAMARDRLRKEAAARRRAIATADRLEALQTLHDAISRKDTRDQGWAYERAKAATTAALSAEVGR